MIEVIQVARNGGKPLLLSVVNWGEVYYITLREAGRERVEAVVASYFNSSDPGCSC